MNATTEPTLLSKISALTTIDQCDIKEILEIKAIGIPTTIDNALRVLKSGYTTEEQKNKASENLAELHRLEITLAENRNQIEEAYRDTYSNVYNCNIETIIILALKKLIASSRRHYEILIYVSDRKNLPEKVRAEHDKIVRQALLTYAVDLKSCYGIWNDFVFENTEEGSQLIEITRDFIKQERATQKTDDHFYIYNWIPEDNPLHSEELSFALENCTDAPYILSLLVALKKKLSTLDPKDRSSLSPSKNCEFLGWAIIETGRKLDQLYCGEILPDTDEATALQVFNLAQEQKLPNATAKARQRLVNIWMKWSMNFGEIGFDDALKTLKKVMLVVHDKQDLIIDRFFFLTFGKAQEKSEFAQMFGITSFTKFQEKVLKSWISCDPTLEELLEYREKFGGESKLLQNRTLHEANTFEKAISLIRYANTREYARKIAENLASKIENLEQGIEAIKNNQLDPDERAPILKAVLKCATNKFEFEIVLKFITERGIYRKEERLILVEKALELLGETNPQPSE